MPVQKWPDLKHEGTLQAVQALQTRLRTDKGDAEAWEALGLAYHGMGRLTAAIKVALPTDHPHSKTLDPFFQANSVDLKFTAQCDLLSILLWTHRQMYAYRTSHVEGSISLRTFCFEAKRANEFC